MDCVSVCLSVRLSLINFVPCDWWMRFNGVILPCLLLVDAGLSSANWFYVGVYRSVHTVEWQLIITLEWQLIIIIKIVDTGSGLDLT